jgi:hypothetical protein
MSKELQEILTQYEQGRLGAQDEQALLVYLMNTNEQLARRYSSRIDVYTSSGAILFDASTKRWYMNQLPAPPAPPAPREAKKRAGRPKRTKELAAVSIYLDPEVLETLDRIVSYTTFSRSAYINFIIKRFLQDRKEI